MKTYIDNVLEEFKEISKRIRLVGGEPRLLEITAKQENYLRQAFQQAYEMGRKDMAQDVMDIDINSHDCVHAVYSKQVLEG